MIENGGCINRAQTQTFTTRPSNRLMLSRVIVEINDLMSLSNERKPRNHIECFLSDLVVDSGETARGASGGRLA